MDGLALRLDLMPRRDRGEAQSGASVFDSFVSRLFSLAYFLLLGRYYVVTYLQDSLVNVGM
jgi:hypothetical protein